MVIHVAENGLLLKGGGGRGPDPPAVESANRLHQQEEGRGVLPMDEQGPPGVPRGGQGWEQPLSELPWKAPEKSICFRGCFCEWRRPPRW